MTFSPFIVSPWVVVIVGTVGFGAVLGYDILQLLKSKHLLSFTSLVGVFGVLIATFGLVFLEPIRQVPLVMTVLTIIGIVTSITLMVRSVYSEIPHGQIGKGINQNVERTVIRTGTYRLCRHPGFLWYTFLVLVIAVRIHRPMVWLVGTVLVALDLAVVVVEDVVLFPKIFSDYREYQKDVPMLIPRFRRKNFLS